MEAQVRSEWRNKIHIVDPKIFWTRLGGGGGGVMTYNKWKNNSCNKRIERN